MTDLERVQSNWKNLRKVKEQTEEMCGIAVGQNRKAARYIRDFSLYKEFGGAKEDIKAAVVSVLIWFTVSGVFNIGALLLVRAVSIDMESVIAATVYSMSVFLSGLLGGGSVYGVRDKVWPSRYCPVLWVFREDTEYL